MKLPKNIISATLAFFFSIDYTCTAQSSFYLDAGIQVTENGNILNKAMAGGLDCPMYSTIDLNMDGVKDLFIFDHKTNRVLTFLNNNIPNTVSYQYAPQYEKSFPPMHDWAILYDYNNDGYEDIFTYGGSGIAVYGNLKLSPPQFTLVTNQINTHYKGFPNPIPANIWVNSVSIPALSDLDNDGDMDIISLAIGGNYFEYQKNYSMDSTGQSGLLFYNIRVCWGYFTFGSTNNYANLPPSTSVECPPYSASTFRSTGTTDDVENKVLHGGIGAICAIDMEGDGDKGLLIGTDYGTNLLYVENGGTPDSAYITSQDTLFPSYNTGAYMNSMPGPFVLDVNNDGKKDILTSRKGYTGSYNFLINNSGGTFTTYSVSTVNSTSGLLNPIINDFNTDGKMDVTVTNYTNTVSLLFSIYLFK